MASAKPIHDLKAGDIMVCSWGYDQTNVDWYRVKKVTGKATVLLVKISGISFHPNTPEKKVVYRDMSCHSKPDLESKESDVSQHRFNEAIQGIRFTPHQIAKKWDGQPTRESWYA